MILSVSKAFSQTDILKENIDEIISGKRAVVGVAICSEDGLDTLSIKGTERFPMQSVYKYHLALTVLNLVEKGKIQLKDKIVI